VHDCWKLVDAYTPLWTLSKHQTITIMQNLGNTVLFEHLQCLLVDMECGEHIYGIVVYPEIAVFVA